MTDVEGGSRVASVYHFGGTEVWEGGGPLELCSGPMRGVEWHKMRSEREAGSSLAACEGTKAVRRRLASQLMCLSHKWGPSGQRDGYVTVFYNRVL